MLPPSPHLEQNRNFSGYRFPLLRMKVHTLITFVLVSCWFLVSSVLVGSLQSMQGRCEVNFHDDTVLRGGLRVQL